MNEPLSIQIRNRSEFESNIDNSVWLRLPSTTVQLHATMQQVNIIADNPQDFFINGFESSIEAVSRLSLGTVQAADLDEMNYLAAQLTGLAPAEIEKLNAADDVMAYWNDIHQLVSTPKARKMLSDWNAQYIQSLMKLIETQSKSTLAHWAVDYAERVMLPLWSK